MHSNELVHDSGSETGRADQLAAGPDVYLSADCRFIGAARIELGEGAIVGPGVRIYAGEHPAAPLSSATDPAVRIGAGAWLGEGVVVAPGVTIGAGALVRAGSVVVQDLPPNALASGNPARVEKILEMGAGCGPRTLATLTKLGVRAGNSYSIRSPFVITVGRNTTFGDAVHIAAGCEIHDTAPVRLGHGVVLGEDVRVFAGRLGVIVGDGARVGARAVLRPGAVVGAGEVVPEGAVVEGTMQACGGAVAAPAGPQEESLVSISISPAGGAETIGVEDTAVAAPVFHVTHWKAGSQWVRAVFGAAAPDRVVPLADDMSHFFARPIVPEGIYTPLYVRADHFRKVMPKGKRQRTFVVVRDPRDTLVSWYFSLKHSHGAEFTGVGQTRVLLHNSEVIDGMAILLREQLYDAVAIQTTWAADGGAKIVKYEDLLADQHRVFAELFEYCQMDVPEDRRRLLVETYSFESATGGRKRGQEDVNAHHRKGIAGDWRNHFDERLTRLFKRYYGEALVNLGYERDLNW